MEMFAPWLLDVGPYHWLALAAILIGLEMVMPTQYLMWPGIAAVATGLLAFVTPIDWPLQLAIFAVLSIILVVASHYLPKQAAAPTTPLNQRTDLIIGRTAIVAEDFHNGEGSVTVGDTRWSARAIDGSDYSSGTRVEVTAAESTLLKVKQVG